MILLLTIFSWDGVDRSGPRVVHAWVVSFEPSLSREGSGANQIWELNTGHLGCAADCGFACLHPISDFLNFSVLQPLKVVEECAMNIDWRSKACASSICIDT